MLRGLTLWVRWQTEGLTGSHQARREDTLERKAFPSVDGGNPTGSLMETIWILMLESTLFVIKRKMSYIEGKINACVRGERVRLIDK